MTKQAVKYNCIIIDDEPLAIKVIQDYVNQLDCLTCVATYTRASDSISILNEMQVDLIFLDINMPGLTGIDFIKTLMHPPAVIFTTAYRNFAVDAFELQALDYLLKPISYERFVKAVNRFLSVQQTAPTTNRDAQNEEFIILKADKKQHKVQLKDINYIEGLDNYIKVHTTDSTLICYMSLSGIEMELNSADFVRVHRSFIINAKHVKSFTSAFVEIEGNKIPIGRNYREEVLQRLNN